MINNRQAGRRRGRGGNGGGNAPRQGGQGRADNGNRIDNRARGNANQLYEKYKNLAADSQRQGDRVNTEYYLQFADHYFRVLSDQRGRFEDQQPRRQQFDADMDGDDDFGDEGEPIRAGEQGDAPRAERSSRYQGERYQGEQGDAPRAERQPRQQAERGNGERSGGERGNGERSGGERGNGERSGGERPRRWERDERSPRAEGEVAVAGQRRSDPIAPGEDLAARAESVVAADAPLDPGQAPRRRGRPRREAAPVEAAPVEAAPEASTSDAETFQADRLPPAIGIAAANDAGDEEAAPKPRRRRARTATSGSDAAVD